jgi:integrase
MSSIFKHPVSGIWRIEYRIPGREDRPPVRKSLKTRDDKRALALQRGIDERLAGGTVISTSTRTRSTLSGLLARYVANPPKRHSGATRAYYVAGVKLWLDWGGADKLGQIGRPTVEEFAAHLERRGRRPVSINTALRALRCLVGLCITRKWHTGDNPFDCWERIPEPAPMKRAMSREQVAGLIAAATGDALLISALGCYAGLRIGEILAARWEHVDWPGRNISIVCGDGFRTKSGKNRTIPLCSRLQTILEAHRRDGGYIVRPGKAPGVSYYRFEWRRCLRAATTAAGVPWVSAHTMRHTFASILIGAGVSETKVRRWMGHADRGITGVYIHLTPWDEDIEKLG